MERWAGRVVLVTGASSGIGAAISRLLFKNNMKVVAVDRDLAGVEALASEVKPGEIFPLQADVTKEDDVIKAVKWSREKLGGVDVLINCAGILGRFLLTELDVERTRQMFEVNVLGMAMFTREVFKDMRERGVDDGHIINFCSIAGQSILTMPNTGGIMYGATKHAVRVYSEGLRCELRNLNTNIRVTNLSPGVVSSNLYSATGSGMSPVEVERMYQVNQSLQPDDIANAVLFALSAPPHVQIHELTVRPVGEKM